MPSRVPHNTSVWMPKGAAQLAKFNAEATKHLPTAAKKKCETKEYHDEHYHGKGLQRRWCPGRKPPGRKPRNPRAADV